MYKKLFRLALTLALLCALAGCGKKDLSVNLSAIVGDGDLLPGVKALCSEEEVRAAGVPLQAEALGTGTDPASGLPSVTYGITPQDCTLTIGQYKAHNGRFVFLDGKLTEIHLNLNDKADADPLESELTKLYGAPLMVENDNASLFGWRLTGDCPILVQLTAMKDADGNHSSTQFAVGYIWYDMAGQEP